MTTIESLSAKALELKEQLHATLYPSATAYNLSAVEVPESLNLEMLIETLQSHRKDFHQRAGQVLKATELTEENLETLQALNPLAVETEEGYQIDLKKQQRYLNFLETIKQIDIYSLENKSLEELQELGKKLGFLYTKVFTG